MLQSLFLKISICTYFVINMCALFSQKKSPHLLQKNTFLKKTCFSRKLQGGTGLQGVSSNLNIKLWGLKDQSLNELITDVFVEQPMASPGFANHHQLWQWLSVASGSSSEEHPWECFFWYRALHCDIILTLDWADLPQALIFHCV